MRIGLVSKFGAADGLCTRADHLLKGILKKGHDVHVFTQTSKIDALPSENVHTFPARPVNPHFWLDAPSAIKIIADECIKNDIDVIHVQMNSSSSEFLIPFFRNNLPPMVTTFHLAYAGGGPLFTLGFNIAWKASVFAAKRYDHIILVDPMQKSIMKNYGAPLEKMSVVVNGVDTELFQPCIKKKNNGIIDFVFVGRLSLDKGVHILLEAFQEYNQKNKNTRLTLVGDGLLKYMVDYFDYNGSIRWLGTVHHNRIPHILQNSDIFVIPQNIGGLGLSVIEAMSCGIPVITTAIGATTQLLTPDEGILVNPEDKDALVDAMCILAEDKLMREKMGAKCREKVVRKYSWNKQISLIENIYQRVISS